MAGAIQQERVQCTHVHLLWDVEMTTENSHLADGEENYKQL